jgi:IMP dehydrogenase
MGNLTFNSSNHFLGEGLTFDDVLLVPQYSEVLPRETSTISKVTRNIQINVPILTAAMDTVTEAAMAISIAREGGVGVLHKNMSIQRQAEEVRKVKRSESGLIIDPITLKGNQTIAEAVQIMGEHKIGGIPVIDDENMLIGILTNRDLRFCKNHAGLIKEYMTAENIITAPEGTTLKQAETILDQYKIEKLPVVDKTNHLVGLITYRDIIKVKNYPNSCKDAFGRLRVAAAVGVTADMIERMQALVNVGVDFICIDTAHGHSKGVLDAVRLAKKTFPDLDIVAGNIATGEAALALVEAGADAVKVGVGPGSICTTRVVAGVGVPQLTAIYETAKALHGTGVPVIADGGIKYTGDVVKAIAAGASAVMAGSLFAGTEESPGKTIIYEGRKFKVYRGMGSVEAMQEGSKDRYFQDVEDDIKKLVPEGIVGRVPYKGFLSEVVYQFIGGLKAGMGYCGAKDIQSLQENARFVKITASGIKESHPHDVTITHEAPNYSR